MILLLTFQTTKLNLTDYIAHAHKINKIEKYDKIIITVCGPTLNRYVTYLSIWHVIVNFNAYCMKCMINILVPI